MNQTIAKTQFGYRSVLHAALLAIATITVTLGPARASAIEWMPTDYRLLTGVSEFSDTSQYAVAFAAKSPRFLRAQRLELAVGTITTSNENRLFVSLGPVWRLPLKSDRYFAEVGFSPTLLDGSTLEGREWGGNFHFTSSATVGVKFGSFRQHTLALRAQHTSNGGLNSTNPGLDMIGLNFSFDFDRN